MDKGKTAYSEYKVIQISEGLFGTIFLGSSRLPVKKMEEEMNKYAATGWQVVFQIIEQKRLLLLWSRETVIITLGR